MRIRQVLCYKDKLYVACVGHGGLLVYDKNSFSFLYKVSFKNYFRSPEDISCILPAREDTLFAGTDGPLFWLTTNDLSKIYMLPVGGRNFIRFNYDKGIFKKLVTPFIIKQDLHGNIWM